MRAFSVLSAALFTATAWGATITSPAQSTVWDASGQGQNVAWTSVPTDPSNFTLALVNMVVTPNINVILKQGVLTSAGSTTVDGPASGWPIGRDFQINVIQQNPTGNAILAQSEQFNITGTTTPFSSASSQTSTGTSSPPSQTGSSSGNNGAVGLTVQTGFIAGLALVGALLA